MKAESRGPRQEERALVERMLAGDERAMEEFADGYFPGLYRFALRRLRGDSELTRDIVQTTVVKALGSLGSYRGDAPLFTWLCSCCRNEIAMHFRKKKRLPTFVKPEGEGPDLASLPNPEHVDGPAGELARSEEARLVHSALDLLPPRYARALQWKYLDHLPVREIAERLEIGLKAAESLLTRARLAFRQGYEDLTADQRPRLVAAIGGREAR